MKILKTVSQNMPNMHSNLVLRYTSECCLSFYDRISIIFIPLDFCRHFLSLMTYPPNEFLSSFWKKSFFRHQCITLSLCFLATHNGKNAQKSFPWWESKLSQLQTHHNNSSRLFNLSLEGGVFKKVANCSFLLTVH